MSTRTAMTDAYFDYQNTDYERDRAVSLIAIKASLICAPIMILLCFTLAFRVVGHPIAVIFLSLILAGLLAVVLLRTKKKFRDVPPTPPQIWTNEAQKYLATHGVGNMQPALDEYEQPTDSTGMGTKYVIDPQCIYEGTAEVEGQGRKHLEIRATGWKVAAYVDGEELDAEAPQPLLKRLAQPKPNVDNESADILKVDA